MSDQDEASCQSSYIQEGELPGTRPVLGLLRRGEPLGLAHRNLWCLIHEAGASGYRVDPKCVPHVLACCDLYRLGMIVEVKDHAWTYTSAKRVRPW